MSPAPTSALAKKVPSDATFTGIGWSVHPESLLDPVRRDGTVTGFRVKPDSVWREPDGRYRVHPGALAGAAVALLHVELHAYLAHLPVRVRHDDEIARLMRLCATSCGAVGVHFPNLPFRNLRGLHQLGRRRHALSSWTSARDLVDSLLAGVESELEGLLGPTEEV